MSTQLSSDEVAKLCQDLVYQVAYAFYDPPYIILLKLLVLLGPIHEKALADKLFISVNELRKYMGMLYIHRLAKRYVNKEKHPLPSYQASRPQNRTDELKPGEVPMRIKDVFYWYIDYREFANVVKYRLAMMRRGVDERIKAELGHRGYACPNCGRKYDPLDLNHLFDPVTSSFTCETCAHELVEHDPSLDTDGPGGSSGGGQDRMQRFNVATAPIRDALKAVEGVQLPSINMIAWVAMNVKVDSVLQSEEDGQRANGGKKFQVVLGGEEEKERIERERLAEAQRVQNALPVWHTHSTVTGSATSLGIEGQRRAALAADGGRRQSKDGKAVDDDVLEEHYAQLGGDGIEQDKEEDVVVKLETETEIISTMNGHVPDGDGNGNVGGGIVINVAGVPKPIDDITEDDQEMMTPEEYTAYFEAMGLA
ncbi:hypothetical protein BCR39DRAFT_552714 [Naematelia encephala]|uniref:HTH TFE/IIEalpha-type domain-containing protein n=1 Tax=Naematelia encephala TaxID=71784 RepID=A0A1Y2AI31_9TREE|nr:hypothetical protein BCR39DRAFT_552714 [Naematelia encephala]